MPVHDFAAAIFLLLSLAAVAVLRKHLIEADRESYRNITVGLVILNLASLLRIYYQRSILVSLPFLSEPLFFELVYWTLNVTGSILLVSGVAAWLPIARANRQQNTERLQRLELIRKVKQFLRIESRIPIILRKTLDYMVTDYKLRQGCVYVISQTTGVASFVDGVSATGDLDENLAHVHIDVPKLKEAAGSGCLKASLLISSCRNESSGPDEVIPVLVESKLAALFLLWTSKTSEFNDEDRANLKLAADIISDRLALDLHRSTKQFAQQLEQWRKETSDSLQKSDDMRSALQTLTEQLRDRFVFESVQLNVSFDDGTMERHTIGENLAMLSEKNLTAPNEWSLLEKTLAERKVAVLDIDQHPDLQDYRILGLAHIGSGILVSIRNCGATKAILLIRADLATQRRPEVLAYAGLLPDLFSEAISREVAGRQIATEKMRLARIEKFLLAAGTTIPLGELSISASEFLGRELRADAVRIVTLDADGGFVNSLALYTARASQDVIPENGSLILSLMPCTTKLLETGRPVLVNQRDPELTISPVEAKQIFTDEMQTGLIVPIALRSKVIGAIMVANPEFMQKAESSADALRTVQLVSAVLGLRLHSSVVQVRQERKDNYHDQIVLTDADIRNRIRSSLAGIVGSVEFLREKNSSSITESMEKCLSIIDRSVRRLTDYVTP